jgi:3-oxoacyl-[acyl-carrier-protein] synthase III
MEDYGNTVSSTIPIALKKQEWIVGRQKIEFYWLVLE